MFSEVEAQVAAERAGQRETAHASQLAEQQQLMQRLSSRISSNKASELRERTSLSSQRREKENSLEGHSELQQLHRHPGGGGGAQTTRGGTAPLLLSKEAQRAIDRQRLLDDAFEDWEEGGGGGEEGGSAPSSSSDTTTKPSQHTMFLPPDVTELHRAIGQAKEALDEAARARAITTTGSNASTDSTRGDEDDSLEEYFGTQAARAVLASGGRSRAGGR